MPSKRTRALRSTFLILFAIFGPIIIGSNRIYANVQQEFDLERELQNLYLPPVSYKCQQLLEQHEHQVKYQQRMTTLQARANQVLNSARPNQESTQERLKFTKNEIESKLKTTHERLELLKEKIIRNGCPGITL